MKKISLIVGIALFTNTSVAIATPGWYGQITAGITNQGDQTFKYVPGGARNRASLDIGILVGGAVGFDAGNGWRGEAELAYQTAESSAGDFGLALPNGYGDHSSTSIGVNAFYELNWPNVPRVKPYIGLGVVYLSKIEIDFTSSTGLVKSFSGSKTAAQAFLGARFAISDSQYFDAGVRYLSATDVLLSGARPIDGSGITGDVRADYQPLALTASWGWRF